MRDRQQEARIKQEMPDYPCADCTNACPQPCMKWRAWFSAKWREIRRTAAYIKGKNNEQN